jgi:hypothetical protein
VRIDGLVMGEDPGRREAQLGRAGALGGEGDDEDGTQGQGDLAHDGVPAEGVLRVPAVVAFRHAEEALDNRPRGVAQAIPHQVPHAGQGLLLPIEGDDGARANDSDDPLHQVPAPLGPIGTHHP